MPLDVIHGKIDGESLRKFKHTTNSKRELLPDCLVFDNVDDLRTYASLIEQIVRGIDGTEAENSGIHAAVDQGNFILLFNVEISNTLRTAVKLVNQELERANKPRIPDLFK